MIGMRHVMGQLINAVRFARKVYRHHSTIASLEALDEHTLNDIGLPRADVLAIANCSACAPQKKAERERQTENPPAARRIQE